MAQIGKMQIRDIYALAAGLGMVSRGKSKDDALHDLVSQITGHSHVSEMTGAQAEQVLAELMSKMQHGGSRKPRIAAKREKQNIDNGMSEGQRRKVWYLMYKLAEHDSKHSTAKLGDRLCGIIKKEMGLDATVKDPLAWLTYPQGRQLIEMIKRYIGSAERRAKGGGDV